MVLHTEVALRGAELNVAFFCFAWPVRLGHLLCVLTCHLFHEVVYTSFFLKCAALCHPVVRSDN